MKRVIVSLALLAMIVGTAWSLEGTDGQKLVGAHETLNIIGVQNPKKVDFDQAEAEHGYGNTIFVDLNGFSKICLVVGDEFAVLDKNGTDADGATFQMEDPDLDAYVIGDEDGADTTSAYSIYVRPLGSPKDLPYANITTCATILTSELADFLDAAGVRVLNRAGAFGGQCSLEQVGSEVTTRVKGKTEFANVTAELTTLVLQVEILDADGFVIDTVYVRVPIFNDMLENEYWEYDNHGLKLLQVRIYPWGTDVSLGDDAFL